MVCRSEYGTAVPHHTERFIAADRRAAAARFAEDKPARRVVRLGLDAIGDRLSIAAEATPVGSVWADEKYGGRLYEVVTHAFACGDVISDDPLVVYRDAMNHRAVFTRGVTTFAERFVRRR